VLNNVQLKFCDENRLYNKVLNKLLALSVPILPKWFLELFSKSYVAGYNSKEVLSIVKELNNKGFSATIDILGEHVSDLDIAEKITKEYCDLYEKIYQDSIDSNISIKPSHIGLDISEEVVLNNFQKILKKAKKHSNFLRIDMESSRSTDITFKIYDQLKSTYSETGVVLQAYLIRSLEDIESLGSAKFNARICKGIYQENSKIAIKDSEKIRVNFLKMAKLMSEKKSYACYATHDQHLIDSLLDMIKKYNVDSSTFEFQVLYGVPMNGRLEKLLSLGYKVRVYVPFGPDWYDYSLRRLKENPDIAGYVLKNLFSKNS
jgi:proline dehydrogenase